MKKILAACLAAALLLLAVVGIAGAFALQKLPRAEEPAETTERTPALYTLSEYDGSVALYQRGFAMPVQVFDTRLSSLPEAEQALLRAGIDAESDEQAQKLIEDFTS